MSETEATKPGNKSKNRVARRQHPKGHQPKMTKEERRAKYTQKARDRRNQNRSKSRMKDTICFKCRKRGHAVIDCPEASAEEKNQAQQQSSSSIMCYKCGSKDHALRACKKLTSKERSSFTAKGRLDYSQIVLPFATCFICNEKGHLSSQCTKNTKVSSENYKGAFIHSSLKYYLVHVYVYLLRTRSVWYNILAHVYACGILHSYSLVL